MMESGVQINTKTKTIMSTNCMNFMIIFSKDRRNQGKPMSIRSLRRAIEFKPDSSDRSSSIPKWIQAKSSNRPSNDTQMRRKIAKIERHDDEKLKFPENIGE